MRFNRRQFIALSSFSALCLAFLTSKLNKQSASSSVNVEEAKSVKYTSTSEIPLRFVSVADTGTGDKGQYAVAQAMTRYYKRKPYKLVVLAGDNIYNNGEIEKINAVFERPYQELLSQGVKFQACLGNHDIRTDNGEPQVRYPGFNMQGRYYTFGQDLVQFFALDTNHNADWKTQLTWLDKELSRSKAPWKIVFGHHQIYSSGSYGLNQPFIKTLSPIFQKHGVQLYINGHDHDYERTRSINGTTYLTCGAGAGTRPVGASAWTARAKSELSFAAFELYSDRLEISGIDTKSVIFDKGIIPVKSI
ncbi:metallophosphoesterase family protein [Chlorogloea sp. CCALA 695]|uniref:metallophosphoesterase family protein n=1 Tax=Chlorogloea sp. CCALA 695 TaxID=2107693 RepID=UPI000D064EBF|nr:metallophosphoesterase [Chlorogloea sp. CCALA 695]PSB32711.1 metallophosphoesterase [Chlorogloea sp. CCALA 695]